MILQTRTSELRISETLLDHCLDDFILEECLDVILFISFFVFDTTSEFVIY